MNWVITLCNPTLIAELGLKAHLREKMGLETVGERVQ